MTRDEIQGMCALHTALAKMDGHTIDKKAARYSAMADYVEHTMACGIQGLTARAMQSALWEAVETGIAGNDMSIPRTPFDRTAVAWMEASQ